MPQGSHACNLEINNAIWQKMMFKDLLNQMFTKCYEILHDLLFDIDQLTFSNLISLFQYVISTQDKIWKMAKRKGIAGQQLKYRTMQWATKLYYTVYIKLGQSFCRMIHEWNEDFGEDVLPKIIS